MHDSDPPDFMAKAILKPLLKLSRRRPVSCAICLSRDRDALIFLHKRMKPRKAMAELRRRSKALDLDLNASTLRFGTVRINGASDSMKVLLTMNRLSPGAMRLALLAHLRPAGFQRCELAVDEALDAAPDDEEHDKDDDNDQDDEDDQEDDEPDADAPDTPDADAAIDNDEPDAAHAAEIEREISALRITLAHLVKDMVPVVAEQPGRKQHLLDLAQGAQACLKDHDPAGAATRIDSLRAALEHPPPRP